MTKSRSEDASWTIETKAAYDAERAKKKLTKKEKSVLWLIAGLLVLGFSGPKDIPFVSGGVANYQTTAGTITATDYGHRGKCTVTLDFIVNGKNYTTNQGAARDSCDDTVGKHMWLRYDPRDIEGTVTDNTEGGSLFLAWARLSAGALAVTIGALMLRNAIRSSKTSQKK